MSKFSMTCSCGDVMSVDASSREEAVAQMKGTMNQSAIDAHCAQKHPDMKLTEAEVHAQIDEKLAAV